MHHIGEMGNHSYIDIEVHVCTYAWNLDLRV